jgi:hypothetical protein
MPKGLRNLKHAIVRDISSAIQHIIEDNQNLFTRFEEEISIFENKNQELEKKNQGLEYIVNKYNSRYNIDD